MFSSVTEDVCMSMKFLSNAAVVHLSANTYPQLPLPSVVSVHGNLQFALNRWNPAYSGTSSVPAHSRLLASCGREPAVSSALGSRPLKQPRTEAFEKLESRPQQRRGRDPNRWGSRPQKVGVATPIGGGHDPNRWGLRPQ